MNKIISIEVIKIPPEDEVADAVTQNLEDSTFTKHRETT
jgi:hypothetical protein